MISLQKFVFALIFCVFSWPPILLASTATVGRDGLKKLSHLLATLKPVANLVCLIRVDHQKVKQHFLQETKSNESLRLHLFSKGPWLGLQDMQFTFLVSDLMDVSE